MTRHGIGWLGTFLAMVLVVFVAVDYFTGYDAIGAASRLIWNGLVFLANGVMRTFGGVASALARAMGMRRLGHLATAMTSVGLGYAGSVILSDAKLRKAHGWRDKLKVGITIARNKWHDLHIVWKLFVVAVLIASQIYLHVLLIVFPIAFLVPVIRRVWLLAADLLFGSWYHSKLGRAHRRMMAWLRRAPGYRQLSAATRLMRMRYLCAWRLWRYDARYRNPETGQRTISIVEPFRLWRRGELDRYVGHSLLAGPRACSERIPKVTRAQSTAGAQE